MFPCSHKQPAIDHKQNRKRKARASMSSTPPIPNTNERQEDPSLSTSAEKPKLWKCGDPYKFAPPQEEGDPWDKLLQPMLKRDKEQCDAWKDEVENLLIFAGLFSAIVTAFIIESYKGLKQDPNDAMIFLLSHIAARLDSPGINNSSTGTTSTNNPLQIPVSPIPVSTSRVNVLWFISLVLSLTTVLVGTVGLQWLREHLRYPVTMVPRDKFAMFHMRTEGLERWHVPGIFSALPILLQVALALFLMGLVDFLLSVAPLGVAAPVIAVIGLPLIFSVATTTLPTIQLFASKVLPLRERVPSQCPYRSPQSLVVLTGIYRVRDGFDSVRGYITDSLSLSLF
ncbi:hypothetical protein BDZ97DRAFT_120112 [Flammula alnicola]|nr:hypothetical protein BDZ97DRAFT_120112 [Flammula alnicola]